MRSVLASGNVAMPKPEVIVTGPKQKNEHKKSIRNIEKIIVYGRKDIVIKTKKSLLHTTKNTARDSRKKYWIIMAPNVHVAVTLILNFFLWIISAVAEQDTEKK